VVASAALCVVLCLSADADSIALRKSLLDVPASKWAEVFGTYNRMMAKANNGNERKKRGRERERPKYTINEDDIPELIAKQKSLTVEQVNYIINQKGRKPADLEKDIKADEKEEMQRQERRNNQVKSIRDKNQAIKKKFEDADKARADRAKAYKDERQSIKVEYDKFDNTTTLKVLDLDLEYQNGDLESFEMCLFYTVELKHYILKFVSESDKWEFLDFHPLYFLVDGQRMELKQEKRNKVTEDGVLEQVDVMPTLELLRTLANSKNFEGKLGNMEFRVPQATRDKMKEFVLKAEDLKPQGTK